MSDSLATILTDTAAERAEHVAFKLDDVGADLRDARRGQRARGEAAAAKGLEPGDRVGLMLPNVPYFPVVYFGILRAGCVVVPMNVLLKEREVRFYLEDPGARLVFAWHDFAEAAEPGAEEAGAECLLVKPGDFEQLLASNEPDHEVEQRAADDTAVILYTSGTTGKPKGAELTHANLRRNCATVGRHAGRAVSADDVLLGRAAALPLLRADLHDERERVQRRHRHDAPALRSGRRRWRSSRATG